MPLVTKLMRCLDRDERVERPKHVRPSRETKIARDVFDPCAAHLQALSREVVHRFRKIERRVMRDFAAGQDRLGQVPGPGAEFENRKRAREMRIQRLDESREERRPPRPIGDRVLLPGFCLRWIVEIDRTWYVLVG